MSRRPGWLGVAVALGLGALAGVLAAVVLGGGRSARVTTITVPPPIREDTTLAAQTPVPSVVGAPLTVARDRLARAGFLTRVQGAGPIQRLFRGGWTVSAQVPRAGTVRPTASTVKVVVFRR